MNSLVLESASPISKYSKEEISELADNISKEIILGGNPESAWAFLTKIESLCEQVKKQIVQDVIAEIDKGNSIVGNSTMKVVERSNYSFKNDKVWNDMNDAIKERENILKSLKEDTEFIDEETGEVVILSPAVKTKITYIKTDY